MAPGGLFVAASAPAWDWGILRERSANRWLRLAVAHLRAAAARRREHLLARQEAGHLLGLLPAVSGDLPGAARQLVESLYPLLRRHRYLRAVLHCGAAQAPGRWRGHQVGSRSPGAGRHQPQHSRGAKLASLRAPGARHALTRAHHRPPESAAVPVGGFRTSWLANWLSPPDMGSLGSLCALWP
jgi:hypothetical protein